MSKMITKRGTMSDAAGAVGGVGSAAGASIGAAGGAGQVAPSTGVPGAGGEGHETSVTESTKEAEKGGINNTSNININMQQNSSMSTQDFMSVHETSRCSGMEETPGIDLKKIIEMMMAMELLKSMNENNG